MGNNEMTGPFGAATVFGPKAPPLPLIRLTLALQNLRVGQLMMALGCKMGRKAPSGAARGATEKFLQGQIAPDDPHKQAVYHHFHNNLVSIVEAGRCSGAKILLSTVAVNITSKIAHLWLPSPTITCRLPTARNLRKFMWTAYTPRAREISFGQQLEEFREREKESRR